MDVEIRCPNCRRPTMVSPNLIGRKGRCPGCNAVFTLGESSEPAPDRTASQREGRPGSKVRRPAVSPDSPPFKFQVRVLRDASGNLKGGYFAELLPEGIRLSRKDGEADRWPVGSDAQYLGGSKLVISRGGGDVELVTSQWSLFNDRLASDLAAVLRREASDLNIADYTIPKWLFVLVMLPWGITPFGLVGGAIGGGLAGGLAGGLFTVNRWIVGRERWARAGVVAALLATSAFGYTLLIGIYAAILMASGNKVEVAMPGQAPGKFAPIVDSLATNAVKSTDWGEAEDPDGNCKITVSGNAATIEVPGTIHELTTQGRNQTNSPRIMKRMQGNFTAEVTVTGDQLPKEPPATGSLVSFQGAGLLVWESSGNFIRFERAAFIRGGNVSSYALFEHHTSGGVTDSQNIDTPQGPLHLRIERKNQLLIASISSDGFQWRTVSERPFQAGQISIGVEAVNTSSQVFHAHFENFQTKK